MIVEGDPRVGDIGLTQVGGFVGWLIDLGQRLNKATKKYAKYEHSMLYVGPGWAALEGQPGGAVIDWVDKRYDTKKIVWVRPVADLTDEQADGIRAAAERLQGTPYSFLDYLALTIKRFRLPIPGVEKYVISTKHMICSQIIVEAYREEGIDLFPGTPSGYVTPADFAKKFAL